MMKEIYTGGPIRSLSNYHLDLLKRCSKANKLGESLTDKTFSFY